MKNMIKQSIVIFATILVAACGGGGGGSSDGAGATSGGTSIDLAKFSGTYSGSITATVTTTQGAETFTENVTFDINEEGTALAVESQQFSLNNESFSVTVAYPLSSDGVVCTLSVTINGNLGDGVITGTVSGNGDCVFSGETISGEISGYFDATRI